MLGAPEPATSASEEPATVTSPPASSETKADDADNHLVLGTISLGNERGAGLVLHPDGRVEVPKENREVGVLHRDGRLLRPDGTVVARMTPEGEVWTGSGQRLPLQVTEDGKVQLDQSGPTLSIGADGVVTGGNPNAPKITIEGVTDQTRRTALFLLVLAAFPAGQ